MLRLTDHYKNPKNWSYETNHIIENHRTFLEGLGHTGSLLFAGRTDLMPGDKNLFGIAVVKAPSMEDAKEMMAKDPAVIKGIQIAEIFPYKSAMEFYQNHDNN